MLQASQATPGNAITQYILQVNPLPLLDQVRGSCPLHMSELMPIRVIEHIGLSDTLSKGNLHIGTLVQFIPCYRIQNHHTLPRFRSGGTPIRDQKYDGPIDFRRLNPLIGSTSLGRSGLDFQASSQHVNYDENRAVVASLLRTSRRREWEKRMRCASMRESCLLGAGLPVSEKESVCLLENGRSMNGFIRSKLNRGRVWILESSAAGHP
jgi:hypothetical protein